MYFRFMPIIEQLASSLGKRDEAPNIALAQKIVISNDKNAVVELVTLLDHKKVDVFSDVIKVLYEIGERKPELIAEHYHVFKACTTHKNKRMIWGAFTAIQSFAHLKTKRIFNDLPELIKASNCDSVIAKDNLMKAMVKVAADKTFTDDVCVLLLEQLSASPNNQFPMYSELVLPVIIAKTKKQFRDVLEQRVSTLEKESQKNRILKVMKKLS